MATYKNNYMPVELLSFWISICILLIMGVVPGVEQSLSGEGGMLYSYHYRYDALYFILYTLLLYAFLFLFFWIKKGRYWISNSPYCNISNYSFRSPPLKLAFFFMAFALPMWFYANDVDLILNPVNRFHSESGIFSNIAQLFLLAAMAIVMFNTQNNPSMWLFVFLLLLFYLVYPVSISSRSAGVPFIVMAAYFWYVRSNFVLSLIALVLTGVFVAAALLSRGNLGIYHFFYILINNFNPLVVYDVIEKVFPGAGSTGLALEMFESNETLGVGRFLLYISPVPSVLLPNQIFSEIGFTEYLGASNIGLNADIFSEWVFWFGSFGWVVGGGVFFLIVYLPVYLVHIGVIRTLVGRLFLQISVVFFFLAGMSMQLRAASRIYVYVVVVYYVIYFLKRSVSRPQV
jgi:hypothetical protein